MLTSGSDTAVKMINYRLTFSKNVKFENKSFLELLINCEIVNAVTFYFDDVKYNLQVS